MSERDKNAQPVDLPSDGVSHYPADAQRMAMFDDVHAAIRQMNVPVLLPAADPNARLIVAAFDGTGNDAHKDPLHATNVAKIAEPIVMKQIGDERIAAVYLEGPGTQDDFLTRGSDLVLGHTYPDRLEEMYSKVVKQANEWAKVDPDIKISVLTTGFSRGASQAAGFSRMLDERGIVDLNSMVRGPDGQPTYTRHIVPPGQVRQVVGLFDPVATGLPMEFDRRLPASVEARFQLTSMDERRVKFVSDQIVPMGLSADGRSFNGWVPGAHSNVGGGYLNNGLSQRCGNAMIAFCNATSEQPFLKPLPVPDDPRMNVIHRSEEGMLVYRLDAKVSRLTPEGINTQIGGVPNYVAGKAALGSAHALGVVATTYDAVRIGERIATLLEQDNLLGAKHELRDYAVNNANAWVAAYTVGKLGAELGGRRGVPGAIAGGIAGGVVGYVLSDKAMAGVDGREIANQTDSLGRQWTFNRREWVRPMEADLDKDGVSQAQSFSADFDTRRELDYKATNTSVEIALRRLPAPRDPYSLEASSKDSPSLQSANWVRDAESGKWQRNRVADVNPNGGYNHQFEVAPSDRAAQLDKQAAEVVQANIDNGPAVIAARYDVSYRLNGWGTVPNIQKSPAVEAALSSDSLQASNGQQYQLGTDGTWRSDDNVATGNVAAELSATRAALQPKIDQHAQTMAALPAWQRPTQEQLDLSSLATTYAGYGVNAFPESLAAIQLAVNTTRAQAGLDATNTSLTLDTGAQGKADINSPIVHLRTNSSGVVQVVATTTAEDIQRARDEVREQGLTATAPIPDSPELSIAAQSPQERDAYEQTLREANRQGLSQGENVAKPYPHEKGRFDTNSANAMVFAAGQEDSTYLKLLLDHGGDPNTRNANNESLLFHTRMQQTSRFNAKLLVERGADVNAQAQGGTIIEDYGGYGGFEMVYWLLQHGADPSLTYPLDKPLKRPDSSTIQSIFWYPEHPQVRNWQRLCQQWLLDHGFKRPPMSELYRDKRRDCGHSIIEKDVPLVLPLAPPHQGPVEIRVCQPISLLMKEEKERQERNKPSHSRTNQAKD